MKVSVCAKNLTSSRREKKKKAREGENETESVRENAHEDIKNL